VEIEGQICKVYVLVRPGTEFFLQRLSKCYELVIYTASLSKYADPLMDILDKKKLVDARLFREHCTSIQGVYVKDMSLLGRPLNDSMIIDNSPTSYTFHPENAIPILSWYDDPRDRCLFELIPLLESLSEVDDVRKYIPQFITHDHRIDFQAASHVLANAVVVNQAQQIPEVTKSTKHKAAAMI
jgi:RNA polymerase II subunit A small phosphatase-like protein